MNFAMIRGRAGSRAAPCDSGWPVLALSIKSDLDRWQKDLDDKARRQVPFALARALNDSARQAVGYYRKALPSIFDRPVPFTLNSAYAYGSARKDNLTAVVALRFTAIKGTPAEKYLAPQIDGGARRMKRFERAIGTVSNADVGTGMLIPGRNAELDGHGNVSRGQIVKILSQLSALGDASKTERTLKRLRRERLAVHGGGQYFLARSKAGGLLGVWKLLSKGHVGPVFFFARKRIAYTPRLNFSALIAESYARTIEPNFATRLAQALAAAR